MKTGGCGRGEPKHRFPLLFLGLIVVLALEVKGIVTVQALDGPKLARQAQANRMRSPKELQPVRGRIYDRDGELLATSIDLETVTANPSQVDRPGELATKLAPILGKSRAKLYGLLTAHAGYQYLARKASKKQADAIRKLGADSDILTGVNFEPESKRYHPGGALGAQVIGFLNFEGKAASGLELTFDKTLRGKTGYLNNELTGGGEPLPKGRRLVKEAVNGTHMTLTLDRKIQFKAEQTLKRALRRAKAKAGAAIVMDPRSGDIYAMASYPTFDLDKYYESKPEEQLNRGVSNAFEPGSTMKIVTAAAAIEEGLYQPSSVIHVPPSISVGGWPITDSHPHGHLDLTVAQVVAQSSNIGVSLMGQTMGKELLYEYICRFGLNSKAGVDIPGEGSGWLPAPADWSASSIGNIPFGQGISATSLEMLKVMSIIANGGRDVRPRLVSGFITPAGKRVPARKFVGEQIVSTETAARVADMMELAASSQGTGSEAEVPGYRVAGKTGTAQKIREDGKGYDAGHYIASFAGFVPAERPELAIIVVIDDPGTSIYGGVVAAPAFGDIARFSLRRLEIEQ